MTYWTPRLDFWVSYTSYIFIRNPEINSSFFPIYLINILYTRFLVLTHRYGRDGRDSKKFEDKSLVFDFCFHLNSFRQPSHRRILKGWSLTGEEQLVGNDVSLENATVDQFFANVLKFNFNFQF